MAGFDHRNTASARILALTIALLMLPPLPLVGAAAPVPLSVTTPTFANITATAGVGALDTALPPAQQAIEDVQGFLNGGKGAAWFDYDQDGWEDLFVTGYLNRSLFRNNRDSTFTDVTRGSGLEGHTYAMAVLAPDINNDGWPDLLISNWMQRSEIFLNNGDGSYRNVTVAWGINFNTAGSGMSFGDLDGDGWGEISWGAYMRRPNGLFKNLNGTGLVDIAKDAGVEDGSGFTFQTLMFDYDRDGDLDVYDVNDFGPDQLFRNDGNFSFTPVSSAVGVSIPGDGMGGAIGDINDDGYMDVYVTNFDDDHLFVFNPSTGAYEQQAQARGISDPDVGWGVQIQDFNNDGYLDIFVADGRVIEDQAWAQPDRLFLNQGNGTFKEVGEEAGLADTGVNRGTAAADFDQDGRLDLWVSNVIASSSLHWNTMASLNHWLQVQLEGVVSVRDAVGARITVTTGSRTQVRDVHMGSSYLSQDSLIQQIGLGAATRVDELTVEWPSGVVQRFANVSVDRRLQVREWEGNRPTAVVGNVAADAGEPVRFNGSASFDDTKVVAWRWEFTGLYAGLNLSGPQPDHTFYFPDNFTGNLTVTDAFGNSNTTTFNVSIRPVNHPLVYAGPDLVLAEDATVDFTATLQGMLAPDAYDRTTFEWQIDGPVGSDTFADRNISYTFVDPGRFTVVVVATDQFGSSGTDTVLVQVTDALPPMIILTPPLAVDEDTLVRFDASMTTDNDPAFASTSLFYWTLEGPMGQADVQTGPVVQFVLRDPGLHRFAISVNDSSGNQASLSFVVLARDITPPVAEAGGDRVVRAGTSVTLDASTSSDNDPAFMEQGSFVWSYAGPDGMGEVVGVTGKLFVTNPGTTTVRLRVVDPTGNPDVVDDVFNITALDRTVPVVPPIADRAAAVGVPFLLETINATDNDPAFPRNASFQWTVADGTLLVTLSGQTANYTFTSLGRWPVSLSVVDAAGNAASQSFFVTVGDPVAPQALGVVPEQVLVGDPVALNATPSHDNVKISSYAWGIVGPGTSVVLNGVYLVWRFPEPGNYTATLTVTDSSGNRNWTQFHVEVVKADDPIVTPPPPPQENGTTPAPEGSWPPLIGVGVVGVAGALGVMAFIVLRRRGRAQP